MDNVLSLEKDGVGAFEVWLDTGVCEGHDGLCIGTGDTFEAAIASAETELRDAIRDLRQLRDA